MFSRFLQRRSWFAFIVLVAVEAGFLLWDIFSHHMVSHDTIAIFLNQYYRLNGIVQYGQVPLWTPFMTQGTSMAWWYALQGGAGLFFDVFALLGGFLKYFDFFSLFYVCLFLYQLLLYLGVWLLSGRYYKSVATRVFVMLGVASGFIPYLQVHWVALVCFVPLTIWLLHRFIDTAQWRWFFFAGYIYLVQLLTCNVGLIPISAFMLGAYFIMDACVHREHYIRQWQALEWGRSFGFALAGVLVTGVLVFLYLHLAQDPWTVNGNAMREPDGGVSIKTFLTYAGNTHLNKWYELVFRFTPALDFTLYMGMFALPCAIAGIIFSRRKQMKVWLGWTSMLFFLSIGSVFAVALYYVWPTMHFYRHLTLLSPMVKFGLCFLAGFGFEALFISDEARMPDISWSRNVFWAAMAALFFGAGIFMRHLLTDFDARDWIVSSMVTTGLPSFSPEILTPGFFSAIGAAFTLAGMCAVMVFVRSPRNFMIAGWVWVAFQAVDIYDYRAAQAPLRSARLDASALKTMQWEPLPWRPRRDPLSWTDDGRLQLLDKKFNKSYQTHDFIGNFTFRDHIMTMYRTDQWQKGLDYYLRAYLGVPFHAPGNINESTPQLLFFSLKNPFLLKISGFTEDKVQVFTAAYYFSSPEKVASAMTGKDYAGDVLLLSSYNGKPFSRRSDDPVDGAALGSDARLRIPYRMLRYTPNEVVIEAFAPDQRAAWLLYSDMWHPSWRAQVNGKDVPVYVANLAYKAVALVPGENTVRFYFHAPAIVFFHWFFAWNAVIVLGIIGGAVIAFSRGPVQCLEDEPAA